MTVQLLLCDDESLAGVCHLLLCLALCVSTGLALVLLLQQLGLWCALWRGSWLIRCQDGAGSCCEYHAADAQLDSLYVRLCKQNGLGAAVRGHIACPYGSRRRSWQNTHRNMHRRWRDVHGYRYRQWLDVHWCRHMWWLVAGTHLGLAICKQP